MALKLTVKGNGIQRMEDVVEILGARRAKIAYSRALNEAGKPAANRAIGAVAKQMGVTRSVVAKRADMKHKRAFGDKLSYELQVEGGYLLMKDFKPSQGKKGVRAGPWGQRRLFRGAFIQSTKLGGNVFHRTSDERLPIQNMFGPAVPKEIVKGKTGEGWQADASARLEKRIAHHVKQMSKGVLS